MFPQAEHVRGVQEHVSLLVVVSEFVRVEKIINCNAVCFQVLIRKFIELHDKYMVFVCDYFSNHTLLHKVSLYHIWCYC